MARISPAAVILVHAGFIITGIVTTLLGPMLPILISRWFLTDRRAGLFFTAQFLGSMLGVGAIGVLLKRGYRRTLVLGFSLIAVGVAGLTAKNYFAALAATGLFGGGLGVVLSSTNLWVAEIFPARRVAAVSILNLMWGLGAVVSAPLVLLTRIHTISQLLYSVAAGASLTAALLLVMSLEPTPRAEATDALMPQNHISFKSIVELASLFSLRWL